MGNSIIEAQLTLEIEKRNLKREYSIFLECTRLPIDEYSNIKNWEEESQLISQKISKVKNNLFYPMPRIKTMD